MLERSQSGRLRHERRPVCPGRPLHIGLRVRTDVPGLRRPDVLQELRRLLAGARTRGLRTVAVVVLADHVHWIAVPNSREALRDAMRYVLGLWARWLNRRFGRRGPVFVDRFWSSCCRAVRHGFQVLNYVLKNPFAAGYQSASTDSDPYLDIDEQALDADPFWHAVLGPTRRQRRALLRQMATERVRFRPLLERLQRRLPGL